MNKQSMNSFSERIAPAILLLVLFAVKGYGETGIPAVHGTIDARQWDFSKALALNGYWAFYDQQLLTPSESFPFKGTYTSFPGTWNDGRPSKSGQGYATYALRVILPHGKPDLALQMPQLYSSYTLWVNGRQTATNGVVGQTRDTSTPQWMPQSAAIHDAGDTLIIVLQIANFHHHIGGIREPVYLGEAHAVQAGDSLTRWISLAEGVFLLLEAIIFGAMFVFKQPSKKIILCFALLCATWGLRALFSVSYPVTAIFPSFNWVLAVKIEYLTLFGLMIWATIFINQLFREASSALFQYIIVAVNVLLAVFTLFASPLLFTRWLSMYLMFVGITISYATVVVLRAVLQEQIGVWFLVISISLGILLVGYDIATYQDILEHYPIVSSIGYIVIFLMLTIALLLHLGIIKSKVASRNILTYEDLYDVQQENKPAR